MTGRVLRWKALFWGEEAFGKIVLFCYEFYYSLINLYAYVLNL
jgi:hypothetical protein